MGYAERYFRVKEMQSTDRRNTIRGCAERYFRVKEMQSTDRRNTIRQAPSGLICNNKSICRDVDLSRPFLFFWDVAFPADPEVLDLSRPEIV